ncbi:PREDICTED: CDP-diacylglycerol--glycerol-3-phosphate 3-phosphatidyltransferase, mitochondrial [Nicrophorus vespilloides]|uniref:CDP-diacylglycerol--glycerol-3-phosphate 3-phosphatidyltransferase n=1 Tax=Nicrophorus vespilloides TaxID=110193 RepID=A0ABM1MX81_NICVS|nr:PREDICTED: CDP-diacylglycerol--glycerol-3-phosphate 3-phosphatidyltransferase, mitochondrial [Nicrophorus vespilloides]
MIRKFLNTVIESTLQVQPQSLVYPSPFTKADTKPLAWLMNVAPCFPVNSNDIQILSEPQEFYETLCRHGNEAKERITLASLYLGNGELERKLVESILSNSNFRDLNINVLLDYSRGSRSKNNSRRMLQPLLQHSNFKLSLYHTPELRGFYKRIAPNRWNELFGIQHMKLYIFDDTLIMSGANLSQDYFTNRQDRYFVIKNKYLCDFYCGLVEKVQGFSLVVDKGDGVRMSEGWQLPFECPKEEFVQRAGDSVESYIYDSKDEQNSHKQDGYDTWVFPLVQMGQLGIEQDANATDRIFAEAPADSKMNIATAYFNLTHDYMKTLIGESRAQCNLLMAHPKANGFLGAKGMAGGIPDGYTVFARRFQRKLEAMGQGDRISLKEYVRDGWTYHAKGLWYYGPSADLPCLTLVGSPNFGGRSVLKDLETQVALVTENPDLRTKLHGECKRLYDLGLPGDFKRDTPKWVYAMVFLFRDFF